MARGRVESIHIAGARMQVPEAVTEVRAIPGAGLDGDRYSRKGGTFSDPHPGRQFTLIESEALEALARDYGVELAPGEARRNVVTRGIALNHMVGREFQVGEVRVRGVKLCEPCTHLEGLTKPGVRKGLIHRGGLRAEILTPGLIRVGDAITF